ncbi:MAG: nicotinamide riboside transporter PnuC [Steroidobacteraceae bacterium]
MAATEAVAVAFGIAYLVLAIRRHRACWIAGGASTAVFIAVYLEAGLPLQAALQALYVVVAVYGWFTWRPGSGLPEQPRSWRLSLHGLALAGTALATAISTPILARYGASAAPLAESLGTWTSLVATWLLARRVVDSWIWWIVIDTGLAALFASQGLRLTALLYLAFAGLAVVGWRSWRRAMAAGA